MARHSGQHSLVIASNRLPIRLTISGDEIEVTRSSGGLATALQAVRGDATWIGWPGTVVPPELQKRVAQRLARSEPAPRPPHGRRGGGLLQQGLQRHALAALPLLLGQAADHAGGLAALRRGERALRRDDPRPLRAREPRLDPRLPPHARARDAPARASRGCRSASSCTRRFRRPRCIASCPSASSSCAACSAPTT